MNYDLLVLDEYFEIMILLILGIYFSEDFLTKLFSFMTILDISYMTVERMKKEKARKIQNTKVTFVRRWRILNNTNLIDSV